MIVDSKQVLGFPPPRRIIMLLGPPLCSFKWVCQTDLGGALQLACKTLWCGETVAISQKYFYWLRLWRDVGKYIISCTIYAISKPTIKKLGIYTPLPSPSQPSESISMDYLSGFPSTKHRNDYVFVVVDKISKMAILVTYKKSITKKDTTRLLFEQVWVHFGNPWTIILDQDNKFLSTF